MSDARGRFSGRVALVSGGGRGIGRACALAFAREGADVAVSYVRHADEAADVVREVERLGGRAVAIESDAAEAESARALVGRTLDALGRLDVVVANAGVGSGASWTELSRPEWDRIQHTNAWGPVALAQAAREALSANAGAYIVVASIAGLAAFPEKLAYAASKAAALSVTRSLAYALAPRVRVNAVAPGWVVTDMTEGLHRDVRIRAQIEAAIPRGRWGHPNDVANAVLFLASDDARFITGETLVVDGGESIYWQIGGRGEADA